MRLQAILLGPAMMALALSLPGQAPVSAPAQLAGVPTMAQSIAALTPEQRLQYDAAGKQFNAQKFAEALPAYKALLLEHPGDPLLAKMAGESSVDAGDPKFTIEVLQPVERQNPDDWQAAGILARAYNESGDKAGRDAEIAHMLGLYKKGATPRGMTQYILEKVHQGGKEIILFNSFEPWGNYKIYNYARVLDAQGKLLQTITLESADFDQPMWAKQHPKEAAAGGRMFSLDGYVDGGTNAAGQHTQTHATFGFLDARPTYDEVRADFLRIVAGKGGPMSTNNHAIP